MSESNFEPKNLIDQENIPSINYSSIDIESETTGINDTTEVDIDDPHGMAGSNIGTNAALMNLVKGNIGTGILAMPAVAKYAGLFVGPLLIMVVGFISTHLTHVLLKCANDLVENFGMDRSKLDYTETVFFIFAYGPVRLRKYKGKVKHLTNIFMLIAQIGFCCAYLLFITVNIKSLINDYFNKEVNLNLVAFCVFLVLLCMCWIKNLKVIAYVALVANFCALLGAVLIMVYCLTGITEWRTLDKITGFNDFLIGFGIAIFAFEAINLVLPIQNKMKYPERYVTKAGVVNTAMVFVVCLYTAMSFFGYLRFRGTTDGTVTLNIPPVPYWLSPIKILFIFSILTSFLLQLYIPVIIFGKLLEKLKCHRENTDFRRKIHLRIIPPAIVLFSFVFAIGIPKFDLMVSLLGAVSSSYLALILPPVLNLVWKFAEKPGKLTQSDKNQIDPENTMVEAQSTSDLLSSTVNISSGSRKERVWFWISVVKDVAIFLFGMIGFLGGTASSIIKIVNYFTSENV